MHFLQNKIIKGTLILTVAGFITRILGFFYRIFLAGRLGASLLGTYQLIFPVYGIAFTIYGAGIQTAISQLISSSCHSEQNNTGKNPGFSYRLAGKILFCGICLSLCLSTGLFLLISFYAEPIAAKLLLEVSCAPYLRIMSCLFPFCGISACLNGYYYGMQDAKVPAATQVVEQIFRLGLVYLVLILCPMSAEASCRIAVWGLVAGEAGACFYILFKFIRFQKKIRASREWKNEKKGAFAPVQHFKSFRKVFPALCSISITLTATKLVVALLNSAESIFVPAALRKYGFSPADALALYGILSGMVMPFLLFPSSITNSIAVMLLPAVADAGAAGRKQQIRRYVSISTRYCLLIGFSFTIFFLLFGHLIGDICFHDPTPGKYLRILSWICPFLYLSTTLNSIINGLGKNRAVFLITVISQSIKIFCLVFGVPVYGITAYIFGLIFSQIVMASLSCFTLRNYYVYKKQNQSIAISQK